MSAPEARAAAERAARASYGRLIAILAAANGDLALAEDALATAFERALRAWPAAGVPTNPEGWLLTVARNHQRDVWRSAAHRTGVPLGDEVVEGRPLTSVLDDIDLDGIGDRRLELLFVCAHPAIDPAARTPLMLQVVLGFDAAQIAAAFNVSQSAMAKRLVRAKRRIKEARIRFAVPDRQAEATMNERLPGVLEAIYGCYAITHADESGYTPRTSQESLVGEARYLAVTLAGVLTDEPEAWGLAALITLSLARSPVRESAVWGVGYIPLEEQDTQLWNTELISEGETYLRRASAAGRLGRFQLEAAIQAVHCDRRRTGTTDWPALRTLYAALVTIAPTRGASVALAAIIGRLDGPEAGLAALPDGDDFQPAWATRAHLLAVAGRRTEAAEAYARAAMLAGDSLMRRHLQEHEASLRD